MSVMVCTGVTFIKKKKNACLVAKIVSFDTAAGLHLLTFRI